ncbi:hypothetical protein M0R01_04390 [bacterium]|jgi:hypothetical protein|nr:hypothetical protein [bacterium]
MNWDELNNQATNKLGYGSIKKIEPIAPTGNGSGEGGYRTDRHNNPTAMTTDVAATLGLTEGKDYTKGDSFSNGQYYTAKLSGNGIDTTIKGMDNAIAQGVSPFYTKSGQQRWTHTAISDEDWKKMTYDQKKNTVLEMYKKEGGSGKSEWIGSSANETNKTNQSPINSGWDALNAKAKNIYEPTEEQKKQSEQKAMVEKTMAESPSPYKLTGPTELKTAPETFEKPSYDSSTGKMTPAKFPITDKDNFITRMAKTAFNVPSESITNLANIRIGDIFNPTKKTSERIGAALDMAPAIAGMIPAVMGFTTKLEMAKTSKIPVISQAANITDKLFQKVGEGLGYVGAETVDALPISDEAKNNLRNPFANALSTVGMLGLLKTGFGLTNKGGESILKKTGLPEKVQKGISTGVKAGTGFMMDPLGTTVQLATGQLKSKLVSKIAQRQADGIEITPIEAQKVMGEVAKETPIKTPGNIEIPTPEGKIKVNTNQKLVLENFIKGQEDINYKTVKSLGKDIEGNKVVARFEWNYKKQEATIYTTKSTTASNLAHELGHYFDTKLVNDVNSKLSDLLPDYKANKEKINDSLAKYAVDQLKGNATAKQITSTVKKLVDNFNNDIKKLSIKETRAKESEQFASAVREVIINPKKSADTAPAFTNFIQYFAKEKGFIAEKVKEVAKIVKVKKEITNTLAEEYKKLHEEKTKSFASRFGADEGAKLKGGAMERSAVLRKMRGEPTAIELQNITKYLNAFYKGKKVSTPEGEGKVSSVSFGKIGVKLSDGKIKFFDRTKIQSTKITKTEAIEFLKKEAEAKAKEYVELYSEKQKGKPKPEIIEVKGITSKDLIESKTTKEIQTKLQKIFGTYNELEKLESKDTYKKPNKKLSLADDYMADIEHAANERNFEEVNRLLKEVKEKLPKIKEEKNGQFKQDIKVKIEEINQKAEIVAPRTKVAPHGKPGGKIEAKNGHIASTGLKTGKFVENKPAFNPDKINAPEDVETLIKGISKVSGEFKKQRISKSNEDIKSLANEIGVSADDLIKTQPGSIANSETIFKSRQIVADLAQDLRDTVRKITTETATPEQLQEVKTKLFRLQGTMKAVAGFRTEAAHIFRQFNIEAMAGENDIMTDLVSQLKKLDGKAGESLEAFTKGSKELLEPTIADKMWHLWYMSILSGESTQIKNFFGNFTQLIGETAVEGIINPSGFKDTMGGLYKGLLSGWGKAKEIMAKGETSKFEEKGTKPIKFTLGYEKGGQFAGVKKIGADILNSFDYVGRFMSATDSLFREGFRGMENRAASREQAINEGLKGDALLKRTEELNAKPTEEIIKQSDNFAQRGTYTQKPAGVIGVLSEFMGRAARKIPGGKFVLPFTRIVANVVNNSLDWTPIGIKRALMPEGSFKTAGKLIEKAMGKQVVIEKLRPRARNQELGRAVLGTIAMGYFASLAMENNLSGNGPSNINKKKQLQDSGWRPNSIKIGDKWYPYQNWGPMAIPMTLVGNYFDFTKYEKQNADASERVMAALLNTPNSILDMSFLSGVADLVTAVQNVGKGGENYFKRFLASQITSPVPNLFKQTARYFDQGIYETGTLKELILSNLRITTGLKPKLNVFGQPTKGEALTQLQPVRITSDQTIKFLAKNELWVSVPSKATKIRPISERKDLPKNGRPMTEDEYYNYVKYSGIEIKKRLDHQITSIENLQNQEKQQKIIDDIVKNAREATKRGIEMGLIK